MSNRIKPQPSSTYGLFTHLSEGTWGLKQNCTQFLTPSYAMLLQARNHLLIGQNSNPAINQSAASIDTV